ncbi:periplasmic heavy metal sensor [Qingshengfaniella alkalisoli]|nr:periplasmic heavy metal sensor [Qingshengfaniella alkalisoli]
MNWVRKKGLGLKLLLAMSLGVNILVLGAVLGSLWGRPDNGRGGAMIHRTGMFSLLAVLPPENRKELRRELDDAFGDQRPVPDGNQLQVLREALRSEPFDPDHFRVLLAKRREALDRVNMRLEEALASQLALMTPEERRSYANRLGKIHKGAAHRQDGRPRRDY